MTTVLIADDLMENRYMLESLFMGSGLGTITAENGKTALDELRTRPVDVIISDILMPVMDGFALCRECKKDELLASIPFVFYTATYTDTKDEQFALSLGADLFLIKPQQPEVLLDAVKQLLHGKTKASRTNPFGLEMEFFRQHNAVLFSKLEDKMLEVEHEIAERKHAEAALRELNQTLEQRIRERTAQLEDTNKELEAFAYSVSHDLRAPLQSILSYGDLLQERYTPRLDEKGQRLVEIVCAEAKRMGELINDLLQFSRLGKDAMRPEFLDMWTLFQAEFDQCTKWEPERHIDFRLASLPPATADHVSMRQLAVNLLSNAIKYTRPREQAIIEVGGSVEGPELVYWVKDNGVGFDMKNAQMLFDVFQRMHSQEQFEGTGLGLAIVRRIVQRHQGRVWAESVVDQGTTIFFALPGGR